MSFDDKILEGRLKQEPEFLWRLQEVLGNWKLQDKPGLVIQARPVVRSKLDVMAVKVRNSLREGVDAHETSSWWNNFESLRMLHNLHGITGLVDSENPTWLTEAHRDGHMLAGVWSFPDAPSRAQTAVLADWYVSFFVDALKLMANVASTGELSGEFAVTATLVNADKLRYAARNPAGYLGISGEVSLSQHAQWSVSYASIGSADWHALAKAMARGIAGAYRAPMR